MEDIVEFIEKRRKCFKNSCLSLEPLSDWIFWASAHGTLYYSKTGDGIFNAIGICWRVEHKDYSSSKFKDFIDVYNPFIKSDYDLFVLDFFAEDKESRNELIRKMVGFNSEYKNCWAQRGINIVKIPDRYVSKLLRI